MPDRRLITFARQMRHTPTDAEKRIWSYLRAHRLDGHHFRRQHPIGNYIADFYCQEALLVVELDGGQHADPEAVVYDQVRTQAMESRGLRVVRFSDYDALKDAEAVAATILREVENRVRVRR
jgi:very-short-patch-repair endonuclease